MKKKKMKINLGMTIVSVALVFAFVIFMALKPDAALSGVNTLFNFCTDIFGVPLMLFTFITFLLSLYLIFSKYGDIKLGEGKPEYSNFSYISMMALAALASAALYWSFTEWGYYYMEPGLHLEPYSVEAAENSLAYAFFHWGFATQAPYVLCGCAIGYAVYNRKVKLMKVSSVCEYMLGNFKWKKPLCKLIDLSVIFCIVGALGCTLGLAVPLGTGALKQVFGIETTFPVQLGVVIFIGVVFTITSFVGIDKGMQRISTFSSGLCIAFLIYVLIAGPTKFIVENFFSSVALMFNNYLKMSFFTDPITQSGFKEEWTLFFQAFALTYTAMMGIFVAKISKGRTIRQVSACCLLGVSISVWVLFGIDGGFAMNAELNGLISVTDLLGSGAGQDLVYSVIAILPGGLKLLPIIMMVIIVGFVASSLDSASFSLAQTTSSNEDGKVNRGMRIFWCFILVLVPVVIMFVGADFSALKSLAIIVSIPFMFVVIFMEVKLFRWLKQDYPKLKPQIEAEKAEKEKEMREKVEAGY
ncbi:MAG: BCCT family transporter [Clostridiales bacterium]|nr:BCCT family transporter [Clostridiales bacterium]